MVRIREAAKIVEDAGGRVVGRTKLQKLAFFLEMAGLGDGFAFEYRRFGPYSEELFNSIQDARLLGFVEETEHKSSWGGTVSIYSTPHLAGAGTSPARRDLASVAVAADSIELELAATALFLHLQGEKLPWYETARRKPEKTERDRLLKAKLLYQKLRDIATPVPLPDFVDSPV